MAIEHYEFNTKAKKLTLQVAALKAENETLKTENETLKAKKTRKTKEVKDK